MGTMAVGTMELQFSLTVDRPQAEAAVYDTIIIGGGPGGLSAALYAARAKLRTLVLDMNPRAGALATTQWIANYPGVPEPVTGAELLDRFRRQAQGFGAEIVQTQVVSTDLGSDPKQVFTSDGVYRARTVVIASGALARKASIPGEAELLGKGVSYCAACDAAFFQGDDVAVIGNSEAMADELGIIARFARNVYLVPRGKLRPEDAEKVAQYPNVRRLADGTRPLRILGEGKVSGVEVEAGGGAEVLPVAGVFIYLKGNRPATGFVDRRLGITEEGCIDADPRDGSTGVPGVFAVGDVTCHEVRQAVVAAAQGAVAALAVDKYLRQGKRIRNQWN